MFVWEDEQIFGWVMNRLVVDEQIGGQKQGKHMNEQIDIEWVDRRQVKWLEELKNVKMPEN